MKKLLIDAGNSNIKWSLLDDAQLSDMQSYSYSNSSAIDSFKKILENVLIDQEIKKIIIVSVLGDKYIKYAKRISAELNIDFFAVKSESYLAGITNAYRKPYKLGADRLVGMVAAYNLETNLPKKASIVVDSGTATTIDAIDHQGKHLGGVILSGLDLCTLSLLEGTELLPLFNKSNDNYEPSVFSSDTKQAIMSGGIFGLAGAINSISLIMEKEIQRTSGKNTVYKIISGGAAQKLLPYISDDFKLYENLLIHGLKIIAETE